MKRIRVWGPGSSLDTHTFSSKAWTSVSAYYCEINSSCRVHSSYNNPSVIYNQEIRETTWLYTFLLIYMFSLEIHLFPIFAQVSFVFITTNRNLCTLHLLYCGGVITGNQLVIFTNNKGSLVVLLTFLHGSSFYCDFKLSGVAPPASACTRWVRLD